METLSQEIQAAMHVIKQLDPIIHRLESLLGAALRRQMPLGAALRKDMERPQDAKPPKDKPVVAAVELPALPDPDELISVRIAATEINVPESIVEQWMQYEVLKRRKVGRQILVRRGDLEDAKRQMGAKMTTQTPNEA